MRAGIWSVFAPMHLTLGLLWTVH